MTFDYFKLVIPDSAIEIIDASLFTNTISQDGIMTNQKYKQETPFLFEISIDLIRHKKYIKFSGKSLLESYPDLISMNNIHTCFQNINNLGICRINPDMALMSAIVCECDITADRPYHGSIKELMNSLMIENSSYTISQKSSTRFYLQTTYVTKRKRECLVVYDKGAEIKLRSNQPFLSYINNRQEQLEYFSDKIRFELNLRSMDRIRKYLHCSDTSLRSILDNPSDPIAAFLEKALAGDNLMDDLIHRTPKLRELEHLILMLLCGWDLSNIERVVRKTTGKKNSISATMKPYRTLYQKLNNVINGLPMDDVLRFQNQLIDMLVKPEQDSTNDKTINLRSLYGQHNNKNLMPYLNPLSFFCINHVRLPLSSE